MGPAIIIAAAAATTGGIIAANQSDNHVRVNHRVGNSLKIGGTLKNISSQKLVDNLKTEIAIT